MAQSSSVADVCQKERSQDVQETDQEGKQSHFKAITTGSRNAAARPRSGFRRCKITAEAGIPLIRKTNEDAGQRQAWLPSDTLSKSSAPAASMGSKRYSCDIWARPDMERGLEKCLLHEAARVERVGNEHLDLFAVPTVASLLVPVCPMLGAQKHEPIQMPGDRTLASDAILLNKNAMKIP